MFSIFTLLCTLVSLGIVLALEMEIEMHSYKYTLRTMQLSLRDKDFDYKYIDWEQLPLVTSVFMALYEGTSVVITIYSETSEPKKFFKSVMLSYSIIAFCGIFFGYFSYLALGDKIDDIILLVIPNGNKWSVFCKVMYLVTIMGSYVLMLQPVFNIVENYEIYT